MRPVLKAPWQYADEGLPSTREPEELWFCRESTTVLIRSVEGPIYLARYREYLEDGQPDPDMAPVWMLNGRDGYSLDLHEVDAWAPTPRWD